MGEPSIKLDYQNRAEAIEQGHRVPGKVAALVAVATTVIGFLLLAALVVELLVG